MPEVMFVIKSLVFSVVLVMLMQVKVGRATAEDHLQDWMRNSSITGFIKEVATGGGLAIKNAAKVVSEFASDKFGGSHLIEKQESRASRFNFEFKRSPAYEKSKENN